MKRMLGPPWGPQGASCAPLGPAGQAFSFIRDRAQPRHRTRLPPAPPRKTGQALCERPRVASAPERRALCSAVDEPRPLHPFPSGGTMGHERRGFLTAALGVAGLPLLLGTAVD